MGPHPVAVEYRLIAFGDEQPQVAQVLSCGSGDDGVAQSREHGAGVECGERCLEMEAECVSALDCGRVGDGSGYLGVAVDAIGTGAEHDEPLADAALMEQFYRHLAQTLDDIEFHKGREPTTIMLRLRKLFQRAQPDQRELRVLHGILADAQRMAGLAKSEK